MSSQADLFMNKGAYFSDCKKYRYSLWRDWDLDKPKVAFIGLNPSTADETEDDPTIRRCINYAKRWGYGGLYMLNIFAFRATDPKNMKACEYPIEAPGGDSNDFEIVATMKVVELVICAWGAHGSYLGRSNSIRNLLSRHDLHYLKITKSGEPGHPLYLKGDLEPILFNKERRKSENEKIQG